MKSGEMRARSSGACGATCGGAGFVRSRIGCRSAAADSEMPRVDSLIPEHGLGLADIFGGEAGRGEEGAAA